MDLRSWFRGFSSGEREILANLREHVELAQRAASLVGVVVEQVSRGDLAGAHLTYVEIDKAETTADESHREVVERLSNGVFFSNLGTDLMNLAEKVDGVADSAKDAAKILTQRQLRAEELAPIKDELVEYLGVSLKAVMSLNSAISGLGKDREAILKHAREVEEYEEVADLLKNGLVGRILGMDLPVLSVLQLKDFVNIADNISDNAEDAADVLYVIVSKGYT